MTIKINGINNKKTNKLTESNLIDTDGYIDIITLDFKECFKSNCSLISICSKKNNFKDIKCVKNDNPLVKEFINPRIYDNKYSIKNTKTTEFLTNVCQLLTGEASPSLLIKYCALSSAYDIPNQDTALQLELGRVPVSTITRDNQTITVTSSFGLTDCNTLQTTIASVTSASVFTVNSVTGLSIGDRIKVTLSTGEEERKISNISSKTITLATPLSITPSISNPVYQMVSRIHLITGGTIALNSGTGLSLSAYSRIKESTQTATCVHTIKIK